MWNKSEANWKPACKLKQIYKLKQILLYFNRILSSVKRILLKWNLGTIYKESQRYGMNVYRFWHKWEYEFIIINIWKITDLVWAVADDKPFTVCSNTLLLCQNMFYVFLYYWDQLYITGTLNKANNFFYPYRIRIELWL